MDSDFWLRSGYFLLLVFLKSERPDLDLGSGFPLFFHLLWTYSRLWPCPALSSHLYKKVQLQCQPQWLLYGLNDVSYKHFRFTNFQVTMVRVVDNSSIIIISGVHTLTKEDGLGI